MKKGLYPVVVLVSCVLFFCGCIKNRPYVTTINPSLSASFGTYNFIAATTTVATLDTQVTDTSKTLIITGSSSDPAHTYDKIVLSVNNYKAVSGVFSIVQGQASAVFYHNGIYSPAAGGIVSITAVTTTTLTGYFNFNTVDGLPITNGKFTVGLP